MFFSIENHFSRKTFNHVIDIFPDFIVLSSGPNQGKDKSWIDEFLFFNVRFYLFLVTKIIKKVLWNRDEGL